MTATIERAQRQADQTLDRVLGRSRPSILPWLAAAIGVVAVVGVVAALLTWGRRPGWLPRAGSEAPGATDQTDTGIEVTAYGESSIAGMLDPDIGEADFAVDGEPSPFEEPRR